MSRFTTTDELAVAHHEAGHAIAAIEVRIPIGYATVEPGEDGSLGHVRHCHLGCVEQADMMLMFLAGAVAEERFTGRPCQFAASDLKKAGTLIGVEEWSLKQRGALTWMSDEQRLERWKDKARAVVTKEWPWIARVARFLIVYRTLTQHQILVLKHNENLEYRY